MKKLIAFPDHLIQLIEIKARFIGFSFGDYVRYVLANEVEAISEKVEIYSHQQEEELIKTIKNFNKENKALSDKLMPVCYFRKISKLAKSPKIDNKNKLSEKMINELESRYR